MNEGEGVRDEGVETGLRLREVLGRGGGGYVWGGGEMAGMGGRNGM